MQPVIARRLIKWQHGQPAPPWELMVCPTYRCNLKCSICARSWQDQPHPALLDELTDERWLRLVDEGAELGVRYLNIGGGGEPTLRRELIMAMCARAKIYGMEGHLQTNGGRLAEDDLEALILMAWDHVTISLDGPTAEINDAIRFTNSFEDAVNCIDILHALKKKRKASRPIIQINMVATALNFDKLDAMIDFCLDHGVEFLSAVPLLKYSANMNEYRLSHLQHTALPDYVARAMAKANAAGLQHNLENLLTAAGACQDHGVTHESSPAASWPAGHMANVRCLEPWRGMVVASSGHAMPCCFFWDEHADSIRNKSLRDVWFGSFLTAFRARMRDNKLPDACAACAFPDSHTHCQLRYCVEQEALSETDHTSPWRGFIVKAWHSLLNNGLLASLRKYHQWRTIRRSIRNERRY